MTQSKNSGRLLPKYIAVLSSIGIHLAIVSIFIFIAWTNSGSKEILPEVKFNVAYTEKPAMDFSKAVYDIVPFSVNSDEDIIEDRPKLTDEKEVYAAFDGPSQPSYYYFDGGYKPYTGKMPFSKLPRKTSKSSSQTVNARIMPDNPRPSYPYLARVQGIEGTVVLKVEVRTDGKPGRIEIVASSGYSILDEAALEAVKNWTFSPAKKDDCLIDSWLEIPVRFVLTD